MKNNSNIINLLDQALKDVENVYRNTRGFDMSYEKFETPGRKA